MSYWSNLALKSSNSGTVSTSIASGSTATSQEIDLEFTPDSSQFDKEISIQSEEEKQNSSGPTNTTNKKTKTKAQDELKVEIDLLNSDLVGLEKRKSAGRLNDDGLHELKVKRARLIEATKKLKQKKADQERKQKSRKAFKETIQKVCETNPDIGKALKLRNKTGRPTIETDQPFFLKSIIDIALYGSRAHEKRRSDVYRSIKTLDELTAQLKNEGYQVSRSAVYTRLLPRRSLSQEGRRHITTVPVKLIRAQNDAHSKHIDMWFCSATIKRLEELSSLLGPEEVCFISQDDKAKVPIGLTAANKQAPILMHVEYRVSLPDHDWVIASKHKLIPSVYACIEIKQDGLGKGEAVGYSGPTYVAIRSGKHSSSTAYSHGLDFERLLNLPEFEPFIKNKEKRVKPLVVLTVDGGPDENPRFQKVIDMAIHHFLSNDLDALFLATNAPGRSAFNRVERRMAPLSRALSGLILSHDHFGSHLDNQGKTIDCGLEKMNFEFAGQTLASIWSGIQIDKFPCIAEYILPEKSELDEK